MLMLPLYLHVNQNSDDDDDDDDDNLKKFFYIFFQENKVIPMKYQLFFFVEKTKKNIFVVFADKTGILWANVVLIYVADLSHSELSHTK